MGFLLRLPHLSKNILHLHRSYFLLARKTIFEKRIDFLHCFQKPNQFYHQCQGMKKYHLVFRSYWTPAFIWFSTDYYHSIGLIIDSINAISSSVSLYLAYRASSVHAIEKSCTGTNWYVFPVSCWLIFAKSSKNRANLVLKYFGGWECEINIFNFHINHWPVFDTSS